MEIEAPSRGHTVTELLAGGPGQNRNAILQRVMEEYRNLWTKIARDIMGSHRCRSVDAEDVLQESLKVLSDKLALPDCPFQDRQDIRRWMIGVIKNNARTTRRDNARLEGASIFIKEAGEDIVQAFLDAVGSDPDADPTADIEAMEHELQERVDAFNAVVEATLANSPKEEQPLLNAWLKENRSLDWLEENFFGRKRHKVRRIVDDFKADADAGGLLRDLRDEVAHAQLRRPGVGSRLKFGLSSRLILPSR